MLDAVLLALVLVAAGAHAVVPWQAAGDERARRLWSRAALPVLLCGAVAALLLARAHPDAASWAWTAADATARMRRVEAIDR